MKQVLYKFQMISARMKDIIHKKLIRKVHLLVEENKLLMKKNYLMLRILKYSSTIPKKYSNLNIKIVK